MECAVLASLPDETPEGKSIVELGGASGVKPTLPEGALFVPFTARTRMSGVDEGRRSVRKGASDAVIRHVQALGGQCPTISG
jgi:K+-transporting ATPase ATPase B chain